MTPDDISSFGTDVPKRNKKYWIRHFQNLRYRKTHQNHLDPIRQIEIIQHPGKYKIFYMIESLESLDGIIGKGGIGVALVSEEIQLEEL